MRLLTDEEMPPLPEPRWRYVWLVELFERGGNSMGRYHTGLVGLGNRSRSTDSPYKAAEYTKNEAIKVSNALNVWMKANKWRAVEHGFQEPYTIEDLRARDRAVESAVLERLVPVAWMLDPNGDLFTAKIDEDWQGCQRLYALPHAEPPTSEDTPEANRRTTYYPTAMTIAMRQVEAAVLKKLGLTFAMFRQANVTRCLKWHPQGIESWSSSDWLTAVTGELGELASLIKMRNRERDGLPGNKFSPTQKHIADEIADVLTYLDLLAASFGVDLGAAAVEKFNEVSERVGFPDRIPTSAPLPPT
jgi:NTP pyrophosphatase (non-canonical NTP hydrolase)